MFCCWCWKRFKSCNVCESCLDLAYRNVYSWPAILGKRTWCNLHFRARRSLEKQTRKFSLRSSCFLSSKSSGERVPPSPWWRFPTLSLIGELSTGGTWRFREDSIPTPAARRVLSLPPAGRGVRGELPAVGGRSSTAVIGEGRDGISGSLFIREMDLDRGERRALRSLRRLNPVFFDTQCRILFNLISISSRFGCFQATCIIPVRRLTDPELISTTRGNLTTRS